MVPLAAALVGALCLVRRPLVVGVLLEERRFLEEWRHLGTCVRCSPPTPGERSARRVVLLWRLLDHKREGTHNRE
tara:strand:+ start:591 stop:815 length:225 start_codon:yes stop_codon:yes gene_type:complete